MAVRWVKVVTVCTVVLGACGGGDDLTAPLATSPTETSTSATTDAPATTAAASTSAPTTAPTTAPPTTAPPEPATALAVIDALAAAGLPIGTTVEYTDVTDPNENLGRPGQYIAKAGWIDTRVDCVLDEPGWDCGGDVELFDDADDLDNRWNYLVGFADTPPIGGYYMWRSDTAIIRVGFVIAPSLAYEYQAALGTILGGVEAFEELPAPATTTTTLAAPAGTAPAQTPGMTDAESARLVFWASFTGDVRDIIVDRLPDVPDVETVERVDFDPDTDTVIIAVTSASRTRDRQIDTAWKLTEIHAVLWKEGGANDGSDWAAALRVTSSAVTFECSGEFMVRLAADSASRADWLDECST